MLCWSPVFLLISLSFFSFNIEDSMSLRPNDRTSRRRLDLIWEYHRKQKTPVSRSTSHMDQHAVLLGSQDRVHQQRSDPAIPSSLLQQQQQQKPNSSHVEFWRKGRFFHRETDETLAMRDPMYCSLYPDKASDPLYTVLSRHAVERGLQLRRFAELRGTRDLAARTMFHSAFVLDRGRDFDGVSLLQSGRRSGGRSSRQRTPDLLGGGGSQVSLRPVTTVSKPTHCPLGQRCVEGLGVAHVVVLRDPLDFAVHTFYALSQRANTRLSRGCPEASGFAAEGSMMGEEHLIHATAFALRRYPPGRKGDPCLTYYLSRYRPQYATIAGSTSAAGGTAEDLVSRALGVLQRYRFLVGHSEHLDELLVLMANRMGWSIRDVLLPRKLFDQYIPNTVDSLEFVAQQRSSEGRHWAARWPEHLREAFRATRPIREDYRFNELAARLRAEQREAYGVERLDHDVALFRSMHSHLAMGCDGKLAPEIYSTVLGGSKSGSQRAKKAATSRLDDVFSTLDRAKALSFDCSGLTQAQEVICEHTEPDLRCMLRLFDECKAKLTPEGFCRYNSH